MAEVDQSLPLRHRAAAAFAFAGVLALASIITRLAAALALALIVPLARVLTLVCHLLNGRARIAELLNAIRLGRIRAGDKSCKSSHGNDILGVHSFR
jgi:hypothetical protein